MRTTAMRAGFIGYGSMTRKVIDVLRGNDADFEAVGILTRNPAKYASASDFEFCDNLDALLKLKPDIIAECATQAAVSEYSVQILSAGVPLVVASVGALAEQDLYDRLLSAARRHNTRVILATGAIGGIDALSAARYGEIHNVIYRGIKPASSWKGSPAEQAVDLDTLTQPFTFFRGNAREAARQYPRNSNVAATVALAGIGFERTRVELVADPDSEENRHQIIVDADSSCFEINLSGRPSVDNPKTSVLSALSVARAMANFESALIL